MGEAGGRQGDGFTGKTVHTVAGHELEVGRHVAARKPLGEECGDHRIADGEFGHTRTDGRDHARAIGHGDAAIGGGARAGDHAKVVIVERAGVNAHLNLAGSRRGSGGQLYQFQVVQAAGGGKLHGFHSNPWS